MHPGNISNKLTYDYYTAPSVLVKKY